MSYFLLIAGSLLWVVSVITFLGAQTAFQEIFASIIAVSGSVLVGCGAIVTAIEAAAEKARR